MSILLDGGKKTGRGTLKGIAAVAKRGMHQKLKIEFSAKWVVHVEKTGVHLWMKWLCLQGKGLH